ncbi:MAG: SDR family NAD(P)-dependent oxidoreductase [Acidobacteriia bacterium]|nr:SDR family NAD(P)-dependent oxidoreductase [Terriglobia bacterium]
MIDLRISPHTALKDQTAIVTGGGRGIGRAIALRLASAGAAVAVFARSAEELAETVRLVEQAGGRAAAFPVDVTVENDVREAVAKVLQTFGSIELLVNNAGMLGPLGPADQADIGEWWRAMEVNVRGPLICTQLVMPFMISHRAGRVVNMASGAGAVPFSYFSSYVTSKTALVRLTECLAAEVKQHGICMFAAGPGTVRTAMSEHSLNSPEGKQWIPWFRRIFDEGLDVPPERPAELIFELASGKADALSGRFISISDDLDVLVSNAEEIQNDSLYALRVRKLSIPSDTRLESIRLAGQQAEGMTLQMEHTFSASQEQVFSAWTNSEAASKWFLPEQDAFWIEPPQLDAKPNGSLRFHLISVGKEFDLYGVYSKIEAPDKLVFSWKWESIPLFEGAGDTLVTIRLSGDGHVTRVELTQERLPTQAALEAHRRGWARCFAGMDKLFTTALHANK